MTTEDDFQAAIDAHPDDWQTLLVFADWLQDHDDQRANVYRMLVEKGIFPAKWSADWRDPHYWCWARPGGRYGWRREGPPKCCLLPVEWYNALKRNEGVIVHQEYAGRSVDEFFIPVRQPQTRYVTGFATPSLAESLAVQAYLSLGPEQRLLVDDALTAPAPASPPQAASA